MDLEESLKELDTPVVDGEFGISIKFNRLERQFTDKDRMLILFSDISYRTEDFEWTSTIPTVRIPYRDPAMGFLINGVIFSSVGIYSRAPGVVTDYEKRVSKDTTIYEPKVEIVTAHNSTVSIGYKRNAVHIIFRKNGSDRRVPIGVFLKVLSELPYSEILKGFADAPQMLLNGFPCAIPRGGKDLARADIYGIESDEEPSIDECVSAVYSAITQINNDDKSRYTPHWKVSRIKSFLNNLHFKTRQKYEATLSVGNRAVGTYLDQDICVPYFRKVVETSERLSARGEKTVVTKEREVVDYFKLPRGHYITDDDAREIRRYDIDTLRVRTTRSFVLQEKSPMLFRAKGYKLISDIPQAGGKAGDIIDEDLLARINDTKILNLEVYTPNGRRFLHRSDENVELGDFYTILNHLFTFPYFQKSDVTQYEVSNRVIFDYAKQVRMEVEQTYSDIISSVLGSTDLKTLLSAFPSLPSNRLESYLRNPSHKEISQSDITNIMSRAISDFKASALMRETPAEMMPVQKDQYGRLDSFHAPDSDKVGSVQQMTFLSRLNDETGEVEAPYEKVIKGVPTGEIVYVSASKEANKYIAAWNDDLTSPSVLVRFNGEVTTVSREKVDYRDASPFCDMSVSRMCIPFPGFSQPKRALMATKMNGQAIPVLFPERPLVSTGADTEVPCLYYTGRHIIDSVGIEPVEGAELELIGHHWEKNMVSYSFVYDGFSIPFSVPFTATDKESLYCYYLNPTPTRKYGLDDIIFYHQCCDMREYDYWTRINQGTLKLFDDYTKPAMALGVNLRICFKTYGSSTVDDAVLISDRLISDNVLTSIQIHKYEYELKEGEAFCLGWSAPLYSHVYKGEPVITATRVKGRRGLSEKQVFCKQDGEVVYAAKESEELVEVWVATYHHAEVGDKVAGRYGDKSVIAKIIPVDMMPYDPETGETMDVVFSPLGMPSRMNYGRILEVALGSVMASQGKRAIVTPFYPNIKNEIVDLYNSSGMKPKKLFNPVYGKLTERPVMTGMLYIMKLEQMSNLKYSAVGYPTAVDSVFGQPVDSVNLKKGQVIGEMESWALGAAGAKKILNAMYTIYSGDEGARRAFFNSLAACTEDSPDSWDESFIEHGPHSVNKNALATQVVMRMFGLDIEVRDNKYFIVPLDLNSIPVSVRRDEFISGNESVNESEWFKVDLAAPVINPFWIYYFPLRVILGVKSLKPLEFKTGYLDLYQINNRATCIVSGTNIPEYAKVHMITGIDAIIELVKNTTIDDAIARIQRTYNMNTGTSALNDDEDVIVANFSEPTEAITEDYDAESSLGDLSSVPTTVADVLRFLSQMKKEGKELSSIIWYSLPIMPKLFRKSNIVKGKDQDHSFQTQLKAMCAGRTTSQGIYEIMKTFLGIDKGKTEGLETIRGYFFGKGAQPGNHGRIRNAVLSKRVGFSGRTVIVPMDDPTISPFFVGLPWCVVMIQLGRVLAIRLFNRNTSIGYTIAEHTSLQPLDITELEVADWQAIVESLSSFNPYVLGKYLHVEEDELYFIYNYLRDIVKHLVEGDVTNDGLVKYKGKYVDPATLPDDATIDCAVALAGRQPTLHKRSIRSYFVKLVDGYCLRIHHMVCKGYNADFDGDQMYNIQLFGNCKVEALKTLSVMQDLLSEKDGSYTLDMSQDMALGMYCATSFKDNASTFSGAPGQFYFFDNLDELRTQLEFGDLHFYEAVIFYSHETRSYYCSTAGRILANGLIPGCFTRLPFTDKWGICASVYGYEHIGEFCELRHDNVWTTTSITPENREDVSQLSSIILEVYNTKGARTSIMSAQALYEMGLMASDIYSVSMDLNDMSTTVDIESYMHEPQETVVRLNNLYQMGLITDESRKLASAHAWDTAKKAAQHDIISALDANSNTYYMMYSGARGKPDQVMQSVGFIGNISRTKERDIEYPILHGYGHGLTSFDLSQTAYSARIGVISTQAGTKETGYSGRQSVYMTSGLDIRGKDDGHDCGIDSRLFTIDYDASKVSVIYSDGTVADDTSLLGKFVNPESDYPQAVQSELNKSGFIINPGILNSLMFLKIRSLDLLEGKVEINYSITDSCKQILVDEMYSYALAFTEDMKITEKTVKWIEDIGLTEVIAFSKAEYDNHTFLQKEAYLPVDYDTSQYTVSVDGKVLSNEALYTFVVSSNSPKYYYYQNLLTEDGHLTEKAINYLTKKKISEVMFEGGISAIFRYSLSNLFKNIVLGRVGLGLPYLDSLNCITPKTLKVIETYQFDYIPVRTSLTCLSKKGVCALCYGKSLSTNLFLDDGVNLGIAASQAMCEPLSQATLNVGHSGGKRSAGTGLLSGLEYYKRMLKGTMTAKSDDVRLEKFAPISGYLRQNKHDKTFIQIVKEGEKPYSFSVKDIDRLNVPDGAFVDKNDTIMSGLPDFSRYNSTDVFDSALKTRYLLIKEYNKIFEALHVSARNFEIMARAQTSICYAVDKGATSKTKDTSEEAENPTGHYKLMVSNQAQVVGYYSGIASYGFENVASMLMMGLFNPEGFPLQSMLANLITGTTVGSTEAKFISKRGDGDLYTYHRSSVREHQEALSAAEHSGEYNVTLTLGNNDVVSGGYALSAEDEMLNLLLGGFPDTPQALPSFESGAVAQEIKEESVEEISQEEEKVVASTEGVDTIGRLHLGKDEEPEVIEAEVISTEEEVLEEEEITSFEEIPVSEELVVEEVLDEESESDGTLESGPSMGKMDLKSKKKN